MFLETKDNNPRWKATKLVPNNPYFFLKIKYNNNNKLLMP